MTTDTRRPIRQGDILLVPVEPPPRAERVDARGLEIPGEHSGHVHRLEAPVYDTPDGEMLHVEESTTLATYHVETGEPWPERHDTLDVPAGWWRPVQQTEYVPRANPRRRSIVD